MTALDSILKPKPTRASASKAKKPTKAARKLPKDDRPVTRIAFVLREEKALADQDAQKLLAETLEQRGYGRDMPDPQGKSLEEWLEATLLHVASSDVMDAAKKLR